MDNPFNQTITTPRSTVISMALRRRDNSPQPPLNLKSPTSPQDAETLVPLLYHSLSIVPCGASETLTEAPFSCNFKIFEGVDGEGKEGCEVDDYEEEKLVDGEGEGDGGNVEGVLLEQEEAVADLIVNFLDVFLDKEEGVDGERKEECGVAYCDEEKLVVDGEGEGEGGNVEGVLLEQEEVGTDLILDFLDLFIDKEEVIDGEGQGEKVEGVQVDQEEGIAGLPEDMLLEIASRSDLRSLHRLAAVSKNFYSLLLKSNFDVFWQKFHYLILCPNTTTIILKMVRVDELMRHKTVDAIDLVHPFAKLRRPSESFHVTGSSNGILGVEMAGNHYMWNPLTDDLKTLPKPEITTNYFRALSRFGYLKDREDYIFVNNYISLENTVYKTTTLVFFAKLNEWRECKNFRCRPIVPGLLLEDLLYFLGYSTNRGEFDPLRVFSLNVSEDSHTVWPNPGYEVYGNVGFSSLGVFGGQGDGSGGCVCLYHSMSTFINLWILEHHEGIKVWTMLYKIPLVVAPREHLYPLPTLLSTEGELLLKSKMKVMLYNPIHNSMKECLIRNFTTESAEDCFSGFSYIATDMSPIDRGRL